MTIEITRYKAHKATVARAPLEHKLGRQTIAAIQTG